MKVSDAPLVARIKLARIINICKRLLGQDPSKSVTKKDQWWSVKRNVCDIFNQALDQFSRLLEDGLPNSLLGVVETIFKPKSSRTGVGRDGACYKCPR